MGEDFGAARKYGVQSVPTFVILDGSGEVADTLVGLDEAEVRAAVEKVLE